ncbi:MAG TPA: YbaK/EbsC family protein [Bellilinea sp.]|nr:YbaK/EbsC family protein [Bellilinea sp.]
MVTNNVTRFLDSREIPYQAFELPSEKLSAQDTAGMLGVSISEVFKSIVVLREIKGKPIVAIIPGDEEVDLKLLAKLTGDKKLRVATQAEAERLTGLKVGGISPLALLNRGFQFILSSKAESLQGIHISGGQRGLNVRLAPSDLLSLTRAETGIISH